MQCAFSDEGQVIRTMKSGDFFGEIGILNLVEGVDNPMANR